MKTRNLLILAFACGLAILVAGGIKIFQVASSDDKVETLPFGTVAEIGPMTVRVMDVTEADDALLVRVEIRGPGPDDLGAHWKLLVAGEPGPLDPIELPAGEGPTCAGTSERVDLFCTVAFPDVDASYVIAYVRPGSQANWGSGQ